MCRVIVWIKHNKRCILWLIHIPHLLFSVSQSTILIHDKQLLLIAYRFRKVRISVKSTAFTLQQKYGEELSLILLLSL